MYLQLNNVTTVASYACMRTSIVSYNTNADFDQRILEDPIKNKISK